MDRCRREIVAIEAELLAFAVIPRDQMNRSEGLEMQVNSVASGPWGTTGDG
jgi:hypothetical protein